MLDKTIGKGKFESKSRKCIFILDIQYNPKRTDFGMKQEKSFEAEMSHSQDFTNQRITPWILSMKKSSKKGLIVRTLFGNSRETKIHRKTRRKHKKKHEEKGEREESDEIDMKEMEKDTSVTTKRVPGWKRLSPENEENCENCFNTVKRRRRHIEVRKTIESGRRRRTSCCWINRADPQTPAIFASFEINEWKKAMRDEYKALKRNKTWIIVNRPKQKKIVESKWVLRTKLKADGSIERRKTGRKALYAKSRNRL